MVFSALYSKVCYANMCKLPANEMLNTVRSYKLTIYGSGLGDSDGILNSKPSARLRWPHTVRWSKLVKILDLASRRICIVNWSWAKPVNSNGRLRNHWSEPSLLRQSRTFGSVGSTMLDMIDCCPGKCMSAFVSSDVKTELLGLRVEGVNDVGVEVGVIADELLWLCRTRIRWICFWEKKLLHAKLKVSIHINFWCVRQTEKN